MPNRVVPYIHLHPSKMIVIPNINEKTKKRHPKQNKQKMY